MSENKKKILINLALGLVIVIAVTVLSWSSEYPLVHKLCDAFFVAAVLLLGFGGLKAVRNAGSFDMISYGIKSALYITLPWMKSNSPLERKDEDFAAYKERKREERKPAADLLIAGSVYLGLASILLIIYLAAV